MARVEPDKDVLKQALKEAVSEVLNEQREVLHDILAEVVEDLGLAEAIREGRRSDLAERSEVFDVLENQT